MVGYSGTPLARKMGIADGSRVLIIGGPAEFVEWLEPLPEDVKLSARIQSADVVVMFCVTEREVARALPRAIGAIGPTGSIWLCWPKKASGIESSLQDRATMLALMFPAGLVDVKVGAISEVWSGLKFVVRKENRSSWGI